MAFLRWNFPRTGWLVVVAVLQVVAFGGSYLALGLLKIAPSIVLPPLILLVGLELKRPLVGFEFSFSLSRACLGKFMIVSPQL